jgi:hypothetical protein
MVPTRDGPVVGAGQPDHLLDEDAGQPVLADLLRGVLLGIQQQRQRVVGAVAADIGAGEFSPSEGSSVRT